MAEFAVSLRHGGADGGEVQDGQVRADHRRPGKVDLGGQPVFDKLVRGLN